MCSRFFGSPRDAARVAVRCRSCLTALDEAVQWRLSFMDSGGLVPSSRRHAFGALIFPPFVFLLDGGVVWSSWFITASRCSGACVGGILGAVIYWLVVFVGESFEGEERG